MDKSTKALRWLDRHRVGITLALAFGVTALVLIAFARDLAFYFTAMGEALPSGFDVAAGPELEAAAKRLGAWTILLFCGAELGILSAAYGLVNGIVALVIGAFSLRKAARERREQAGNIDALLAGMAEHLQANGFDARFGYKGDLRRVLYCNKGEDRPVIAFQVELEDAGGEDPSWFVVGGYIAERPSRGSGRPQRWMQGSADLCDPSSGYMPERCLEYASDPSALAFFEALRGVPERRFATGGFDDPRIAEAMRRGLDRVGE